MKQAKNTPEKIVSDWIQLYWLELKTANKRYNVEAQIKLMTLSSSNYLERISMNDSILDCIMWCLPKIFYLLLMSASSPQIPVSGSELSNWQRPCLYPIAFNMLNETLISPSLSGIYRFFLVNINLKSFLDILKMLLAWMSESPLYFSKHGVFSYSLSD